MSDMYILEGKTPVKATLEQYSKWYNSGNPDPKRVAIDIIRDVTISTVFLCLNHGWNGDVILFETMVFGGFLDQEQQRYRTWDEAEKGHKEICERVINSF